MPIQTLIAFAVFFTLLGACIGSFLNVVIWRLPHRGREVLYLEKHGKLTLSWPPSHCPVCDAPIHWFQNIPVLSWLALKGKCANCRTHIPIRYPLVELGTAVLFLGFYLAYFLAGWQNNDPAPFRNIVDVRTDYAPFLLHLLFASALLAASAIDADLFIIPLQIPWFLAAVGIAACALIGPPFLPKSYAIIPSLGDSPAAWALAKPVIGGTVGLLLSNVLMALKIMPRSFDGPEYNVAHDTLAPPDDKNEAMAPPPKLTRFKTAVAATLLILVACAALWLTVSPKAASFAALCGGILIFLIGVLPRDEGQTDVTDQVMEEISSPNVRSEILKELWFLLVPIVCATLAFYLPLQVPYAPWLARVLGSLLGLLVGGGVVWMIRVAGSLAFGKEAMGMGDAHLMAGVGAIIGAPLALIAFFLAPFLGIIWAIVLKIMGKPNVLPYGPWLSVSSILVLLIGNTLIALLLFPGLAAP